MSNMDFGKLSPAAGLLFVPVDDALGRLADGFQVGNFRGLKNDLQPEFSFQFFNRGFQMDLPHPGEDDFLGLGIPVQAQGGVFFHEAVQGREDLIFVAFVLGLNGIGDDRAGRGLEGEKDRIFFIGQTVAGDGFFQFGHRQYFSGMADGDWFLRFAFQHEELAETFFDSAGDIVKSGVSGQGPGKDAEDGQPAGIGIGHGFESQSRERGLYGGFPQFFFLGLGVLAFIGAPVQGRREVGIDALQQKIHSEVLQGRTAENGDKISL